MQTALVGVKDLSAESTPVFRSVYTIYWSMADQCHHQKNFATLAKGGRRGIEASECSERQRSRRSQAVVLKHLPEPGLQHLAGGAVRHLLKKDDVVGQLPFRNLALETADHRVGSKLAVPRKGPSGLAVRGGV